MGEKRTVLICDDVKLNQDIFKKVIETKYCVLLSDNGEQAIELLSKYNIDIVITDLHMPIMDGYTLIKAMKGNDRWKDIPIVVATGSFERAEKEVFELGVDDFVKQPYDSYLIAKRVDNLVSKYVLEREKYLNELELQKRINQEKDEFLSYIPGAVAIYRMKKNGKIITEFTSDGLAKMLGYDNLSEYLEYLKDDAMKNVVSEDYQKVYTALEENLRSNKTISVVYHLIAKDGSILFNRLDANRVDSYLNEDDAALYYAVHTLVSDDAVRLMNDQKQNIDLMNKIPGGIGIFEVDEEKIDLNYINDSYYQMMGTSRKERNDFTGKKSMLIVHKDDLPVVYAEVKKLLDGANNTEITYRAKDGNNKYKWLNTRLVVIERNGKHLKVYATLQDFDELMESKHELESAHVMLDTALSMVNIVTWRYDYRTNTITDSGTMGSSYNLPKIIPNAIDYLIENNRVHPDDVEKFKNMFKRISSKKIVEEQIKSITDDNRIIWADIKYMPMFDKDGNYIDSIGVAIDITEQKLKEEQYEERLKLIRFSNKKALSAVTLNLTKNVVVDFNSGKQFTGHAIFKTADELLASIKQDISDPEEVKKFEIVRDCQTMIETFNKGETHIEIVCHLTHDIEWTQVNYELFKNPYTGDIEVISSIYDVSKEIRAKSVASQIIDIDYQSVIMIDVKTGKIMPFSTGKEDEIAKEVVDIQQKEGKGQLGMEAFYRKYAYPDSVDQIIKENSMDYILEQLKTKDTYETSYALCQKGKKQFYRIIYSYLKEDTSILLCAVQRVTDYHEREEKRREELADALVKAEESNKAKTAFLSRISHDMRTPLNGILGITTLLRSSLLDNKTMSAIEQLDISGKYLLNLVNDTLDVSKIENGKLELHPTVCNGKDLFDNAISLTSENIRKKNIHFSVSTQNIPFTLLYVDEGRIEQVVMNVLSNAVKFTPEGGHISLELTNLYRDDGKNVDQLIIRDSGCGISKEFIPHLFESFSQEDGTRTNSREGTGLGLSITKSILDVMGGSIQFDSSVGVGTTVTIILPLQIATDEQVEEWKKTKALKIDHNVLKGKRILLCEDHPLNAKIAMKLLETKGIEVVHVSNGKLGVEEYASSTTDYYDAILMDIRMPVMDGLDATRAIRLLNRRDAKSIPIIAMTANALDMDIQQTCEAGMNKHLSKPIDAELLFKTLEEYLSDNTFLPNRKKTILIVDDIEVNRAVIKVGLENEYNILEAEDGQQALDIVEKNPGIDLIVTDVQMPLMDGVELIKNIRNNDDYRHIAIVVNTAFGYREQEEQLLAMGADDFIYKPTTSRIMELRIKKALNRI